MVRPKDNSGIELSVSFFAQLARYISFLKLDLEKLLGYAGLSTEILKTPDARIPVEAYLAVQDEAVRLSGDDYFGLHMGEFVEPGSYSIIEYLAMNCGTLGQAVVKGFTYERIIGTLLKAKFRIGLRTILMVWSAPAHAPHLSRHYIDATFASFIQSGRNLSGQDLRPLEIELAYPRPSSTAEHERFFRCPVRFDRRRNSLTFDIAAGKIPLPHPDPKLRDYFESYAKSVLAGIDSGKKHSRVVLDLLVSRMADQSLSVRDVAKEMGLGVRTLQLRLKEEGTDFSGLLSESRTRLAKKYLRDNYSVEDLTCLLGFSDPSAFRKAFRKWTGLTPREYRESAEARVAANRG